ncbi:MAG: HNH endonuclease signature motif containing protein [Myxococcota bacterium]|nr:HNH endonuclease signature motif containing protein [Myxococcota bacterium]
MRARALSPRRAAPAWRGLRRAHPGALVFLRGRDADARLLELEAVRRAARPVLGELAAALVERKLYETLGYRGLGDYAREHLGVGPRTVREWARVWRGLRELPLLRDAVLSGEISWAVARLIVGLATPDTQAACLATVRGRTVRSVEALVRAVREAEAKTAGADASAPRQRVAVRLRCTRREWVLWQAARELARRVAGEGLPAWRCAEQVAAEAASALGSAAEAGAPRKDRGRSVRTPLEPGLRSDAFPGLSWRALPGALPDRIAGLAAGARECPARELDRRLRAAIAFLQGADFEQGRILRQLQDRRLLAELGFEGLDEYARERLGVSARTARRLIALARTGRRAPAVATAFRQGRIHAFQAHALGRVADVESARAWVERARRVSFRRLEDEVEAEEPAVIAFHAPREVASFFLAMLERAGSLERLLAHAIAVWAEQGERFRNRADFERDGYRCTAPGCTARRNLHSHHIEFLSRGGPDLAWNRTTLCAYHHLVAVHSTGTLRVTGRAPDALGFELGPEPAERFAAGDCRC